MIDRTPPTTPEELLKHIEDIVWQTLLHSGTPPKMTEELQQDILRKTTNWISNNLSKNHVIWVEDCEEPGWYQWEVVVPPLTAEDRADRRMPFTVQLTPLTQKEA